MYMRAQHSMQCAEPPQANPGTAKTKDRASMAHAAAPHPTWLTFLGWYRYQALSLGVDHRNLRKKSSLHTENASGIEGTS